MKKFIAKEQIEKYEKEVDEILKKAEKIDNTKNDANLPEEIAVRKKKNQHSQECRKTDF